MLIGMFIFFFVMLFIGMPVAFSLGLSTAFYFLVEHIPLITLPQKMFSGMNSFVLLCVPGFILAGNLMNRGGITMKIIDFSNSLVGHIRGGLSLANIVASMVFAGISGTATADAASLGAILIPAMEKDGYETDFSCAVTASSSTIGPIIPPSLPMIIAGTMTGLSVSKLFVAGIIPGILLGFGMMGVSYFISCRRKHPKRARASFKQLISSFFNAFWALLMTLIILVGIIGGFFTPTEASIIAVIYATVVGIFVYKELKLKDILPILLDSAKTTTAILVLIGFANVFAWILAMEQVPQMVSSALLSVTQNKFVMLLLINLLLLFVGTFMETLAALAILFPTLLSIAINVGVDPIQFAIIAVLNLVIGLTTPPVGVCLFVTSTIGKISLSKIARAVLPFLGVSLGVLMLVTYIPATTLWLVGLVF
jgi:tripartite ATP-independent transporter DctM subunit